MINLGFFLYGDYYGNEDQKEGHIEIAKRILAKIRMATTFQRER